MTKSQWINLTLLGVVAWFAVAMLVRFTGPFFFDEGVLHLAYLAFGGAIAWPTLYVIRRVAGVPANRVLRPTALALAVASICDGLALSFAPWIYGPVGLHTGFAGAVILFGVGWLLLAAIWADDTPARPAERRG